MDKHVDNMSIEIDYVRKILSDLVHIPSPTGFTDEVVRYTCNELEHLGIPFEITRRGGIRADLKGKISSPDRSIVAHLDTIGGMVKGLKENGRLSLVPVGTWSARFAEGARVTVFTDKKSYRGTVLPLKASGHAYGNEVDEQPVSWDNLEIRLDATVHRRDELEAHGFNTGDYVAFDPNLEFTPSGFINTRHLDDKAGIAVMLAMAKKVLEEKITLPIDCHLLITISEEVGSGASSILHGDIAEMVTIDTGPIAPGQSTHEYGVTVCMSDSNGPFDYHLTHHLIKLCQKYDIRFHRDIFKYYKCDSASAIEAGNDIRTALVCFGTDGTHGYERCHEKTLLALGHLLLQYISSKPLFERDRDELGSSLKGFPTLPVENSRQD